MFVRQNYDIFSKGILIFLFIGIKQLLWQYQFKQTINNHMKTKQYTKSNKKKHHNIRDKFTILQYSKAMLQ